MKTLPRLPFCLLVMGLLGICTCARAQGPEPHWIWADGDRDQNQTVYLRKSFSIPNKPESAQLILLAEFSQLTVSWNGQLLATVEDYGDHVQVDVTPRLRDGENVLAVVARGSEGPSAVAARFELNYRDGQQQVYLTDETWRTARSPQSGWQRHQFADDDWRAAASFGEVGMAWLTNANQDVQIDAVDDYTQWKQALGTDTSTNPSSFQIPEGFEIELLRSAQKSEDSWVSLAFDPAGRLVVAKESKGLLRFTLPENEQPDGALHVEMINATLEECRGLLFAHGCLYANANNSKGLYRLRDTNGDDQYDEVQLLYRSSGGVGHGRNDLALGPDGLIYSIHGDAVDLPRDMQDRTSPYREARRGIRSKEGHVIRMDRDGHQQELVSAGLRNPFGIDFNPDGEMFTYDADAEFDMGSSWYRPTRVQHLLPGGDYGWRGVTKQWPPYFPDHPDAAPPNLDIGKGSPTAVQFGTHSHFPDPYRRALFVLDWAYGRILAVHLTPRGASYVGRAETFVRGRPLNVTDLTFGPDGAMYFITGGRKTQSGLYRVRYVGSVESANSPTRMTAQQLARAQHATNHRALRRQLESLHGKPDVDVIAKAWPYLDSPDPWLRHAARIAIEHQPVSSWAERALAESRPWARLTSLMALASSGETQWQPKIYTQLQSLPLQTYPRNKQLVALRTYELCFQHGGLPNASTRHGITERLDALYPQDDWLVNRELSRLLARLESPSFVEKTMPLLAAATQQAEQLHYLFVLRSVGRGWTPELRREYFDYFQLTEDFVMGEGMPGFIRQIQEDALASLPESLRSEIESALEEQALFGSAVDVISSNRPFVREWTVEQMGSLAEVSAAGRDLERGQRIYQEAQCVRCHRLGKQGRSVGPDLTAVSSRFSHRDLLQSIVTPSHVVAEKYRKDIIETSDGRVLVGSVIIDGDYRLPKLRLTADPLKPGEVIEITKREIVSHTKSPLSQMPTGLLNTFTRDEILDLLAYIAQGGK